MEKEKKQKFKDLKLPSDTILKLKELRSLNRTITKSEMQFVIDCIDKYGLVSVQINSSWNNHNYNRFKTILFGKPKFELDQIENIKSMSVVDALIYMNPAYLIPKHHLSLISVLDKIILNYKTGKLDLNENIRFLYSCPPRGSKTELITAFIFLILLNFPDLSVVYISNSIQTAEGVSVKIKNAISNYFQLSPDQNTKQNWVIYKAEDDDQLAGGGLKVFTSSSIKQGIKSDIMLIDDLYASRADYESKTIRTNIHESLKVNALSRLEPTSPVVVVSTRYGTNDFISEMLTEYKDNNWVYKNVPAINENGKSYWPKRWPTEILEKKKKQYGPYDWAALYMGDPIVKGNGIFEGLKYYNSIPPGTQILYGVDFAYTEKTKADFTAVCKIHYSKQLDMYFVESIQRWQKPIDFSLTKVKQIVGNQKCYWSTGGTEKSIADMARKHYQLNIEVQPAKIDKIARANKASIYFEKVMFNPNIDQEIIAEIEAFPRTKNDDCVDAFINAIMNVKSNLNNIDSILSSDFSIRSEDRSAGFRH